jgi:hypothetical protein
MATHRFERDFPGKTTQQIFERAAKVIEEIAERYSLKHRPVAGTFSGAVSRPGAEGRYRVEGERLTLELDFSFFVPGAIRGRVQGEVSDRLDRLFA